MFTMPDLTRARDPYTETVALQCFADGGVHDVDDDATTDGDPCPSCASQATTAVVVDLDGYVVRPYVPPMTGTITTTFFPARPHLGETGRIRVTGPLGTDNAPTGYSSGYAHRQAAERYLTVRRQAADLSDAEPVPGGSGYVFTIRKEI